MALLCLAFGSAWIAQRQNKSLLAGGVRKTIVKRDDLERRRATVGGDERRPELEGIRRAQRVHAQEADGRFADGIAEVHLMPSACDLRQPIESLAGALAVEASIPFEQRNRRRSLDLGGPPDEHRWIAHGKGPDRASHGLRHQQRHDR